MAAAGGMAALAVAPSPTSGWPDRRRRRRAAVQACQGKLEAALAKVMELEKQIVVLKAVRQLPQRQEELEDELASRLRLVAPILGNAVQAAVAEQGGAAPPAAPTALQVARRNAATHCFAKSALEIERMSRPRLNALQRGKRPTARSRSQVRGEERTRHQNRYRRQAEQHTPAEAVLEKWACQRRGRSAPLGACVTGDRSQLSKATCLPPFPVTGPTWFKNNVKEKEEVQEAQIVDKKVVYAVERKQDGAAQTTQGEEPSQASKADRDRGGDTEVDRARRREDFPGVHGAGTG